MNETPTPQTQGVTNTTEGPQSELTGLPRHLDHPWHVWINQYAHEKPVKEWPHSLYEFKSMLMEMARLPYWMKKARDNTLPKVHQQCSHSAPEPIQENKLLCAIGENVNTCPILMSLRQSLLEQKVYGHDADILCSLTCCWHIYTTAVGVKEDCGWRGIDTSEGYVQDESDRMFWRNTYESLASVDEVSEPEGAEDSVSMPNGKQ